MKYGTETKTVEAFLRHLNRMTPQEWGDAGVAAGDTARVAAWAAAWDAAGAAAGDTAKVAAGDAARVAAWAAANEIQNAALMRERGQPFYFLPLFGFTNPEAVLAADQEPDAHGDNCWALGAQHYECALREIARQRGVIETWREAHIEDRKSVV